MCIKSNIKGYATGDEFPKKVTVDSHFLLDLVETYSFILDVGAKEGWNTDELDYIQEDKDNVLLELEKHGVIEIYREGDE